MRVWILVVFAACSTHYVPQRPGHVAVTMDSGQITYVRDGQSYHHGVFGTGLESAVVGSPAAMSAAHEYTFRQKTGFVAVMLGLVAECGGATWTLVEASKDRNAAVPLTVMLGGVVATIFGGLYIASAEPYRWDAINLFNDAPALPPGALGSRLPKRDAMLSFPP